MLTKLGPINVFTTYKTTKEDRIGKPAYMVLYDTNKNAFTRMFHIPGCNLLEKLRDIEYISFNEIIILLDEDHIPRLCEDKSLSTKITKLSVIESYYTKSSCIVPALELSEDEVGIINDNDEPYIYILYKDPSIPSLVL